MSSDNDYGKVYLQNNEHTGTRACRPHDDEKKACEYIRRNKNAGFHEITNLYKHPDPNVRSK